MTTIETTLVERVGQMYRRILILQRLFQVPREGNDVEWLGTGDTARDLALCVAIREVLDELTEHARILTSIPFPLSEWRPGDGPDDERWRALTDIERREVLSMVSSYEDLISWGEAITLRDFVGSGEQRIEGVAIQPRTTGPYEHPQAMEYLKAERARVERFRQDMRFLERRRIAG